MWQSLTWEKLVSRRLRPETYIHVVPGRKVSVLGECTNIETSFMNVIYAAAAAAADDDHDDAYLNWWNSHRSPLKHTDNTRSLISSNEIVTRNLSINHLFIFYLFIYLFFFWGGETDDTVHVHARTYIDTRILLWMHRPTQWQRGKLVKSE